jgi:hypothetical protein
MSSVGGQVVPLRKRNDLPRPKWGNQNAIRLWFIGRIRLAAAKTRLRQPCCGRRPLMKGAAMSLERLGAILWIPSRAYS